MSTPEAQNSISSAVFGLQDTLKQLKQQWPVLKKPEAVPNELHALGPVNLDKVREDFSQKINMIRNVCSQFETEVLGDVMKMGIGADPAFRKHFTHLKEQATLESTVMRVKETLKNTKKYLEKSIKDKEESKTKIEVQRLEKLAQSMGLVTFVDSSQKIESGTAITTITLGGTVIVVDIDIDDTGHILRTKLTYVSETLQNDQDERVDNMLAKNLQACDFALFRRNLGSLALLDQLNVKHAPADFFSIVKNLLYDLRTICQQELVIKSDDVCGVLMEGHGIPCLHLDYPGISICYWIDQNIIYNNNWEATKMDFEGGGNNSSLSKASKLLISFEESIQPMICLPASKPHYLLGFEETEDSVKEWENGEYYKVVYESVYPKFASPLRFIKLLPEYPDAISIPIRFTATLDPPVPVSDEICQLLMKSASLTKSEAAFTSTLKSSSLSLEEILVKDHFEKQDMEIESIVSTIKFDGMPEQNYKLMPNSKTPAKLITRIPFYHPVQLFKITQCLRQQQMFNVLFTSIFNSSTLGESNKQQEPIQLSLDDILSESKADDKLRIEITSIETPNTIHIMLAPPSLDQLTFVIVPLSIEIPFDNPTKPAIRLDSPHASKTHSWDPTIFDEDKMTHVIQVGYDVPLLIRWLYKRMCASDTYLIERSHKRVRSDEWSNMNDFKMMKMDIDE